MIAIADYGMGNRRSVEKALAHVGAESVITSDVRDASAIILPGVGAFPEAMRNLERSGLREQLVERLSEHDPGVLDCVMRARLEVAGDLDVEVQLAVAGEQVEHVIEEADPRVTGPGARAGQAERQGDVGLAGLAAERGGAGHGHRF